MHNKVQLFIFLLMFLGSSHGDPMTWEEITDPGFIPRRSSLEHEIYQQRKAEIAALGKLPEHIVLEEVFGLSEQQANYCFSHLCGQEFRMVINSFPYWIEANTVHLLLFSNWCDWNEGLLVEMSKQLLREKLPEISRNDRYAVSFRINKPEHRSVKGLAHAHIFIRDKGRPVNIHRRVKSLSFSKPGKIPVSWPDNKRRLLSNSRLLLH
ncbi:MAG: DUF3605 domain-containing protein [Endozoicomonas sp.]